VVLVEHVHPHHGENQALCAHRKVAVGCANLAPHFNEWLLKLVVLLEEHLQIAIILDQFRLRLKLCRYQRLDDFGHESVGRCVSHLHTVFNLSALEIRHHRFRELLDCELL